MDSFTWTIAEYEPKERSHDWYWAVGIITVALAVAAYIFSSIILVLFIALAGGTVILFALRDPDELSVTINERGVRVNNKLYPFPQFDSFWVEDETEDPPLIILKSEQVYSPLILIPVSENIDPDDVREYLVEHLDEEELAVPFSRKIMEYLGL